MLKFIAVLFFFTCSQVFAQSASIDEVYHVRKGLYCTTSTGDGWHDITFSKLPGKNKHTPAQTWPTFQGEYGTIEYQYDGTSQKYVWSAYVKSKKGFARIKESEMLECIKKLKYDDYFNGLNKGKPSRDFHKNKLRMS